MDDGTTGYHLRNFLSTDESWEEYLTRVEKDKQWGSHIEATAIADVLGIPILITNDSPDDEEFQVWIYPTSETVKTTQLLLLGFCYNHYYSLEGTLCTLANIFKSVLQHIIEALLT